MSISQSILYCRVCKRKFHDETAFHFHKKWSHTFEAENTSKDQTEEIFSFEAENNLKDKTNETISFQVENTTKDQLEEKEENVSAEDEIVKLKNDEVSELETFLKKEKHTMSFQEKLNNETFEKSNKDKLTKQKPIEKLKVSQNTAKDQTINLIDDPHKQFQCHPCNKNFTRRYSLQKHIMTIHERLRRPFNCHLCNKNFRRKKSFCSKKSLVVHTKSVHEKLRPFKCEKCEECFSQKGNLKSHFGKKH